MSAESMDLEFRIDELLDNASSLPEGPTKIAMIEEAVRIADLHQDSQLGFRARLSAIDAMAFGGRSDLELAHFAWCLAKIDNEPEQFSIHSLIWKYKWIVPLAAENPRVPYDRLISLLDDFDRRLESVGGHRHAYYTTKSRLYAAMNLLDDAAEAYLQSTKEPRTYLSDCPVCVENVLITIQKQKRDFEKLISLFEALLARGVVCKSVPTTTYGSAIIASMHIGDWDRAERFHQKSYRLHSQNPIYQWALGTHVFFLVQVGKIDKARKAMRKGFDFWPHQSGELYRLGFVLNLLPALRFQSEGKRAIGERIAIRLPEPLARPDDPPSLLMETLYERCLNYCRSRCREFDERNRNSKMMEELEQQLLC
jgi:tetratricopeptide (TPR) repeat protein